MTMMMDDNDDVGLHAPVMPSFLSRYRISSSSAAIRASCGLVKVGLGCTRVDLVFKLSLSLMASRRLLSIWDFLWRRGPGALVDADPLIC